MRLVVLLGFLGLVAACGSRQKGPDNDLTDEGKGKNPLVTAVLTAWDEADRGAGAAARTHVLLVVTPSGGTPHESDLGAVHGQCASPSVTPREKPDPLPPPILTLSCFVEGGGQEVEVVHTADLLVVRRALVGIDGARNAFVEIQRLKLPRGAVVVPLE